MTLQARTIATDVGFAEGPVFRESGELVFVSIDQGKLYRIPIGAACELFADVGGAPNGATEGLDGTIYVTQTGGRWSERNAKPDWTSGSGIQAVSRDGVPRWVSTGLIAPNDLCFGPDGFLWVTDPTRYRNPRDDGRLFRVDPQTGQADLLCSVPWYPNGIGFGLEDDVLYVVNSGPAKEIMRVPIDNGRLGKFETFIRMPGTFLSHGFAFDTEGNLITGACSVGEEAGQIQTFDRNGRLLDIFMPGGQKLYTNVALNAERKLVTTASDIGKVLLVENWPYAGLPLHPFRNAR